MIIFSHSHFFLNAFIDFKMFIATTVVIRLHENDSDNDSHFRHAYTIAVFLLIKLFYLFIFLLNYLFKFIQILVIFTNLINYVVMSLLIACCLLNLLLKLIFSH